jgi:hypothetical protein
VESLRPATMNEHPWVRNLRAAQGEGRCFGPQTQCLSPRKGARPARKHTRQHSQRAHWRRQVAGSRARTARRRRVASSFSAPGDTHGDARKSSFYLSPCQRTVQSPAASASPSCRSTWASRAARRCRNPPAPRVPNRHIHTHTRAGGSAARAGPPAGAARVAVAREAW